MLRLSLAILLLSGPASAPASDGALNVDFLSACLIAGGVNDPAHLAKARSELDSILQRIDVSAIRDLSPRESTRALQARLHSHILTGSYQADASDLQKAILTGNYNCLSAAALRWELSRRAGVELQIWSRPGHVWLVDPAGAIAHDSVARQITPLALVGKFYYNRGLTLLQAGRHAEGLACMRSALRLDPDDCDARGNLLAGLNNWAAALCREERFDEARRLIDQGLALDGGYAPLVANARYVRAHHSP